MSLDQTSRRALIEHNQEKAKTAAEEVEFLILHKKLELAVNRIYYGAFYALTALSLHENFSTGKHRELIGWFNKNFVKTGLVTKTMGAFLHRAFDNRSEADYGSFVQFDQNEVKKQAEEMKGFIGKINDLLVR